jgi:hypothetical protein
VTINVPGNFRDITADSNIHFEHQAPHTSRKYLLETMGSGVALFDCDGDGLLDLFVVNGAPFADPTPKGTIPQKTGSKYWNRMYRQLRNGQFEDITVAAGLEGAGYGMGVAVGDYDNDGHEDLFVTGYGGNHLYHNDGHCHFIDVTAKAGVGGSGWSTSAAWADLDRDGLLDLVVLRYIQWDWDDKWCGAEDNRGYCNLIEFQPITMLVYHNDGNGHFTEIAEKAGLSKPGKALGISITDYDNDGWPDIFVANDAMVEFLFRNRGDGTFEEVGLQSGTGVDGNGHTYAGMGVDFADYDNDGFPDVLVTDLANQKYAIYHNDNHGSFDYVSYESGIAAMTQLHSGWSYRFFDYDNDGWKDILIAQGHVMDTIEKNSPNLRYREPMLLARNTGKGFVDVSPVSGDVFRESWAGRGLAIGDINNDGRIDAVVTENAGPVHVLMNETITPNHWLTLKLVGHKSNRDGIGAVVKLTAASVLQWVTVTTGGGYLSSSDVRAHFGLGANTSATKIEIRWPSGIDQELKQVSADQSITIDEPLH